MPAALVGRSPGRRPAIRVAENRIARPRYVRNPAKPNQIASDTR
ncbi:hypothetical protein [Streptomyces sp. NPDC058335]